MKVREVVKAYSVAIAEVLGGIVHIAMGLMLVAGAVVLIYVFAKPVFQWLGLER
jgi:hypothetical protein